MCGKVQRPPALIKAGLPLCSGNMPPEGLVRMRWPPTSRDEGGFIAAEVAFCHSGRCR